MLSLKNNSPECLQPISTYCYHDAVQKDKKACSCPNTLHAYDGFQAFSKAKATWWAAMVVEQRSDGLEDIKHNLESVAKTAP